MSVDQFGVNPYDAIAMASLNAYDCYGIKNLGAVAINYYADLVVADDIVPRNILQVYKNGQLVAENGKLLDAREFAVGIVDEWAFWRANSVIVTESGRRYHTYGCYHIGDNGFYIFNLATAQARGYTPCLDCDPPPW